MLGNKKNMAKEKKITSKFKLGVVDVFSSDDSENAVVFGKVTGNADIGSEICVFNFGDDNAQIFNTEILEIDNLGTKVESVEDRAAMLVIKDGAKFNIKPGTIIFTDNQDRADFFEIYSDALVSKICNSGFGPDDAERLSLSECAEIISLEQNAVRRSGKREDNEKFIKRLEWLAPAMKEKLLGSDYIYCVYSNVTGEPYMESKVYRNGDEYIPEPPVVVLITEALLKLAKKKYTSDKYSMVKIENGEDKKGITRFLGDAFYINGAVGAAVLYTDSVISAPAIISKGDYMKEYPLSVQLYNPAVKRCVLLINQFAEDKPEKTETVRKVYLTLMTQVITESEVLVPAESGSEKFITLSGHEGTDAVHAFTDINAFEKMYGEDQAYVRNKISFLAEKYDCMVNPSENVPEGCYIDTEMFSMMGK